MCLLLKLISDAGHSNELWSSFPVAVLMKASFMKGLDSFATAHEETLKVIFSRID